MWNDLNTGAYEGMIAETVVIPGHHGDMIHAYWSRPLGAGSCPGLVLIPHMPGWDEYCREAARRFTQHGYSVLCPNIYELLEQARSYRTKSNKASPSTWHTATSRPITVSLSLPTLRDTSNTRAT